MVKANINIRMDQFMKVNGSKIKNTGRVNYNYLIKVNMKDNFKMDFSKVKVLTNFLMVKYILETGKKI